MKKIILEKYEIIGGHVMFCASPETKEISKRDALQLIEKLSEGFIAWTKKERVADNKKRFSIGKDVDLMDCHYFYTIKAL